MGGRARRRRSAPGAAGRAGASLPGRRAGHRAGGSWRAGARLPISGVAADKNERDGRFELCPGAGVRADQERKPLDGGEAAEVEEDGPGGERRELFVAVGNASGRRVRVPALRVVDQPLPPEGAASLPCDRSRPELAEVDAAGNPDELGALEPSRAATSASAPGGTISCSQARAQPRSRRSHAGAYRQPRGGPAASARTKASSVPAIARRLVR